MSSAADVAHELVERWAAGDRALDLYHPECVWDQSTTGWWEEQTYVGPDEISAFLDTWIGNWSGYRVRLEKVEDAGDGRVAIDFVQSGRFGGSESLVEQHFGAVVTVAGSKITRVQVYDRPKDAWQAAGLA